MRSQIDQDKNNANLSAAFHCMPIQVNIDDHTGIRTRQAKVAENVPIARLLPALTTALGLPLTDPAGRTISYHLSFDGNQLDETNTLVSAGVRNGDAISVIPELTAGGGFVEGPKDSLESSHSERRNEKKPAGGDEEYKKLRDYIESLSILVQQQAENKTPMVELTAPVELPTQDQMKVRLIPAHLLGQLEETRSDQNYWLSVAWTFLGAVLGVIVNWVTAEQPAPTKLSIIIICVFIIVGGLAFTAVRRYSNRAEKIRQEMITIGNAAEAKFKQPD